MAQFGPVELSDVTLGMELPVAPTRRQAILVVGMHRSGTSAITRMFNLLGAKLPDKLLPGNFSNELGHWEPVNIVALHDRMLQSAHSTWDDVFGVDPSWCSSEAAEEYTASLVQLLQSEYSDESLFVVKDPRLAVFVPIWRKALCALDVQPLFVLPFRHPKEVALSLKARHSRAWPNAVWPSGRGELLWLRQVLAAENSTRGQPRSFVPFDALLDDWKNEASRIAGQLSLVWPRQNHAAMGEIDGFLSHRHKHQELDTEQSWDEYSSAWIRRIFDQLHACAADPQAGADVFDGARQSLEDASRLFRTYVLSLQDEVKTISALRADESGRLKQSEEAVAARDMVIASRDAEIASRDKALIKSKAKLGEAEEAVAIRERDAASRDAMIAARDESLAEAEAALKHAIETVAARDQEVALRDRRLADLVSALARAEQEVRF